MLRRGKKKVRLVINKADFDDDKIQLDEAYRLGLGEPLRVSAEHGRGEGELRDAILEELGPEPDDAGKVEGSATVRSRSPSASSAGPTWANPPSPTGCSRATGSS